MKRATYYITLLVCSFLVLGARPSWAAYCGDDVKGRRVACRCGDFVVADTQLHADDPVVRERCPSDGLIIQARPDSGGIVLDLNGLSIVGSAAGVGILVSAGGAGGATVTGGADLRRPGQIVGFGTGMRARSNRSLRALRNLDFRGNRGDGAVLRGHESMTLESVGAHANGRDGLRLGGRGALVADLRAEGNGRHDIDLETAAAAEQAAKGGYTTELPSVHGRTRLPDRRENVSEREQR